MADLDGSIYDTPAPSSAFFGNVRDGSVYTFGLGDDLVAPVVDNFSPANGSTIGEADPIFFDATDNSGLFRRVLIAVDQGGVTELAHDGDGFLPPYDTLSTRTNIDDGFSYRLRRGGGWVDDVTVRAFAIDKSGNEN